MVDRYGKWYEEQRYTNYPMDKWCVYDHMAVWIRKSGYAIKTNMENLIVMILLHYDGELEETDGEFSIDGCKQFVEESGGLAEFDYYC